MRELLMGNEAIAVGALAAGVQVVAGYPGTPSSEVLETIAKRNPGGVHVEWSVNEKAGAEVAVGAAYTGARSMVTMKQMGLNVSSDPVMCVNYIGVKAGMVIYVADDPGPISSQTEQDTRRFAQYARIPVFDCDSPEQAFQAVQDAFAFSEEHHTPVFLRSTTRVCHACADIDVPEITPPAPAEGFTKDSKWVIFPGLSYRNKQKLVRREQTFSQLFSVYQGNTVKGVGPIGIACGGISYAYVMEAIAGMEDRFTVMKIATPYPFPSALARSFMNRVSQILCFEELDPVIEDALINEAGLTAIADPAKHGAPVPILGKRSGTVPAAGEFSAMIIADIIGSTTGIQSSLCTAVSEDNLIDGSTEQKSGAPLPDLPVRPPVLCAGCPHRGAFYAVKRAAEKSLRGASADAPAHAADAPAGSSDAPADAEHEEPRFHQAVYHGDIGCYTLGNAAPLNMVDTCLCMGAGITMAQGMFHADPHTLDFAFAGDSTFFASGITGAVNAVYNQADIILCILDNSTTAMTGHQPHPGMGVTMMGERVDPVRIDKVLEGIGVPWIRIVDPLDFRASVTAVSEAIAQSGVRALIFKSPCIALTKKTKECHVDDARCVGCLRCIREIGCPALSPVSGAQPKNPGDTPSDAGARAKAAIDPALCVGCGLCAQICPTHCIETQSLQALDKPAGFGASGEARASQKTNGKEVRK